MMNMQHPVMLSVAMWVWLPSGHRGRWGPCPPLT